MPGNGRKIGDVFFEGGFDAFHHLGAGFDEDAAGSGRPDAGQGPAMPERVQEKLPRLPTMATGLGKAA